MSRIRVLHILPSLSLGGTEKSAQLLATHLDRERFEAAVTSPTEGPRGVQLRQAGLATYVDGELLAVLERFAPQVVHVHRAGWPEQKRMRPLLLYCRDQARREEPTPVLVETNVFGREDETAFGQALSATLFVSRFCLERFRKLHRPTAAAPRHRVLYNPVDTDLFARLCPEPGHGTGPETTRGTKAVGRISRADPGKWSPLAWTFLPHLLEQIPEARYRVLGMIDPARDYFAAHGLSPAVDELAPLTTDEELAAFLGTLDLLAHANATGESFGLAIAEAMAAGLPVVTHPSPWPKDNAQLELVEHGVTGLVAETPEAYAQAVATLLADPELARRMGRAGRKKAQALFRAQTVAQQLGEIYLELLAARGSEASG